MTDELERSSSPSPSHEDYLNLARSAPRISREDKTVDAKNNLYMLFSELRRKNQEGPAIPTTPSSVNLYTAEKYGKTWNNFLSQNADLVSKIDRVLEDNDHWYGELNRYFLTLVNNGQSDKARELREAINHPLGIEAISMYIWGKLNPLLKRASKKLARCGIDPSQFYG